MPRGRVIRAGSPLRNHIKWGSDMLPNISAARPGQSAAPEAWGRPLRGQVSRVSSVQREAGCGARVSEQGLFRAILAGRGHTLEDAFRSLERAPHAQRIARNPTRDLMGVRVDVAPHEGKGHWDFMRIRRDIYVVVANLTYKDPRLEIVPGDGLISFSFKISGDMSLAVDHARTLRWNRPSLLLWSQPPGVDTREWTAPSAYERFVILSMRPEHLADHFFNSRSGVPEPIRTFLCNDGEKINFGRYPLSSQAFEAAERMINNPYPGALGLAYVEALATELLCHAAAGLDSLAEAAPKGCTDREVKRLEMARAILMRQLAPAPTIAELVRAVGMSKTALTKGFKAVYGETIFDFGVRCRMRHALMMMRDHGWSVEQASEAVGYAHPTSFATAFRNHFGMRPIDVRKRSPVGEAA